jgi:hypothetical protein
MRLRLLACKVADARRHLLYHIFKIGLAELLETSRKYLSEWPLPSKEKTAPQ